MAKIVYLSDIHAGSEYAVKSPKAKLSEDDTPSPMNRQQEILYDFWASLAKEWRNPDKLIINGDAVDGLQPKGALRHIWSDNLLDPANDSITLCQMFNAKEILFIRGTPYHTQTKGVDIEEYMAEKLGAVKDGGRYTTEDKVINMTKGMKRAPPRVVHVTHHIAGSKWFMYRPTAAARSAAALKLNEGHFIDPAVHGKITGMARGHNHYFWYQESPSTFMLQLPAWQLPTPFSKKVAPESPSDIGAVMMEFFKDGSWSKVHRLLKPKELLPTVF